MSSFATELVKRVLGRSGYIANVNNLLVVPGAILSNQHGCFQLVGRIDERAEAAGDTKTAETLKNIIESIAIGDSDSADTHRHQFGLSYKSEGTTMLDFSGNAKPVKIDGVDIEVNTLISFKSKGDYVFDTTSPSPYSTFTATQIDDILAASLKYLHRGELIVIGVVWAERFRWYISKSSDAQLGFGLKGSFDPSIGIDKLAELDTKMSLKGSQGEIVDGIGVNCVAAFQASIKREPVFSDPHVGPYTFDRIAFSDADNFHTSPKDILVPVGLGDVPSFYS